MGCEGLDADTRGLCSIQGSVSRPPGEMWQASPPDIRGAFCLESGMDAMLALILAASIAHTTNDVGTRQAEAPDLLLDD